MRTSIAVGATLMIFVGISRAEEKKNTKPTTIGKAVFQIPGDWVVQKPKAAFRILQWGVPTAEGDEKPPVMYVSELTGGGGGVKANFDRWISEYQDKEGKETQEEFEVDGVKIHTFDLSGTFLESSGGPFSGGKKTPRENYRTLGAVVQIPDSESTYFFKMVGPKKSVGGQREAFTALLKSAKRKS